MQTVLLQPRLQVTGGVRIRERVFHTGEPARGGGGETIQKVDLSEEKAEVGGKPNHASRKSSASARARSPAIGALTVIAG